jgi:hypothetical protein
MRHPSPQVTERRASEEVLAELWEQAKRRGDRYQVYVRLPLPQNLSLMAMTDLRQKFRDVLQQNSPEPRNKYFYATSVTVRLWI